MQATELSSGNNDPVGTGQKSGIEDLRYEEHMLLIEDLGEQADAFRQPVAEGNEVAQTKESKEHCVT